MKCVFTARTPVRPRRNSKSGTGGRRRCGAERFPPKSGSTAAARLLHHRRRTEWTPFAVVADPAELRRTSEGFYGIDSALSWIGCGAPEAGKNMFAGGADLARLLGVSIVRDRLGWNDTQPGPDGKTDWKQFLACARLLRERGLEVLTVFHDAPSAMRRRNPDAAGRPARSVRLRPEPRRRTRPRTQRAGVLE